MPSGHEGLRFCASLGARKLPAMGCEIRPMLSAYVKPYGKRGKTDAANAEAICEAVTGPIMRFVVVKTDERQVVLMLHKGRDVMDRQCPILINALRGVCGREWYD
jgi:transposase